MSRRPPTGSAEPVMHRAERHETDRGAQDGVPATAPAASAHDTADPDTFRRAMAAHAAGVVVVTAGAPVGPVGLTATSFTSVSLAPPLISFYVGATASAWPGIRDSAVFAVNVLAEEQRELATRFATSGVDRFAPPTRWRVGAHGVPLLEGTTAHLLCRRHDILAVGDHWLVVGRVTATSVIEERVEPLLYHRGGYGRFRRHSDS